MRLKSALFYVFVGIAVILNFYSFQKCYEKKKDSLQKIESPCDFTPVHPPCSTKRDVLLLYGTNSHNGLLLAIKSLRATGAKCRVVLLVPSFFDKSAELDRFARELDIEIYPNCDMKRKGDTVAHMLRYEYEAKWISEHLNELDRVIHADGYDVFFQSDPFIAIGEQKGLIFIKEESVIYSCEWNSNWVIDCYNRSEFHRISTNNIVCSGVILGTAKDYLRFVLYMIDRLEWKRCWGDSMDQPIVNYLIYRGLLDNIGLNYTMYSCNDNVLNMQNCLYGKPLLLSERGFTLTPDRKNEPAILHQYNRFDKLTKHFGELCHVNY